MVKELSSLFIERFNKEPAVFHSPGRINFLGEHTDYNEGFVLPAAIDKQVYVAIAKRDDQAINLFAADLSKEFSTNTENIKPVAGHWPNYVLGVVDQLKKKGYNMPGFDLAFTGDIPIGAGLSSSAAVECAVIFALNTVFELGIDKMQMVKLAQKAEHVFAGVMCGIMDQFASMFGKKDHAIKLDCRSLDHEYVPVELGGYSILLLNTNVKHNLASSAYNERRQQCEAGVAMIQKKYAETKSLRDVNMNMLKEMVEAGDTLVYNRCKYVVQENERLLGACEDLKRSDIVSLGAKMYQTHEGLRHDYDVSCKELDFLVDYVKNIPAVAGARMMGGGFGGCTINLVKAGAVDKLVESVSKDYHNAMGISLTAYQIKVENGTGPCS